jgi:hypothetical protein
MPKKKIIQIVYCLMICLVAAFLRIKAIQKIIPYQSNDSNSYIREARAPILSTDFLLGNRGLPIHIFYKIAGVQPDRIVWIQAIFGLLCWSALAFALLRSVSNYWIGLVAFGLAMVFSLGREILVWDSAILSESFSLSLFALTLAFALLLIARWTSFGLAGFFITASLWIFARDSNALVIALAATAILLFAFSRNHQRQSLIVGIPLLALSVLAMVITALTGRTNQPLTHNFERKILTDPVYAAYFIKKGMPISPAVQNEAGRWGLTILNSTDPDITRFREWMLTTGKYVYLQFLISQPKILFGEPVANKDVLLSGGEYLFVLQPGYKAPPAWQQITDTTYTKDLTLFILWAVSMAGLAIFVAPFKTTLKKWSFPLLLLLICVPVGVVIWQSDLMNVERHALLIGVQFHLALWMLILFSADAIASKHQREDILQRS